MSGRPFPGLPDHDVPVPAAVTAAAAGRLLTLTWVNETGGLTYAAEGGGGRRFIRWAPAGSGADLPAEAARLVVCQGDACAPNTLPGADGRWSGHVDLGDLGIADRWADLAIATWSATWNYGPGWEPRLLDAYGIGPDPERTRYYRLLWELSG